MAGHSTWIVPAPMVRRCSTALNSESLDLNRLKKPMVVELTVHSHPNISKNELGCPIIGRSIFHDLSKYRFQDKVFSHKKHLKVAEESWTSMCHTFRLVKAFADNSSHVHVSQIRRLDQKSNIFFVCVRHFMSCQTLLRKAMRDVETTPRTIHDSILESTVSIASRLFQNSFPWI